MRAEMAGVDYIDQNTAREARARRLMEAAEERMRELEREGEGGCFNAAHLRRLQEARADYREEYLRWLEAKKKTLPLDFSGSPYL